MVTIKKILYATDFSECADKARGHAEELAKQFDAEVTVAHVLPPSGYVGYYEVVVDLQSVHDQLLENANKRLGELKKKFEEAGVKVKTELREGTPFLELINIAREQESDIIVLSTHGWGPMKHMILGSTAERVVRKAPCPVLSVRGREGEFVRP